MSDLPPAIHRRLSELADAYGAGAVKRLWDGTETWPDLGARVKAIEDRLASDAAKREKLAHQASLEDAALEAQGKQLLAGYEGSMREAFGAFMDDLRTSRRRDVSDQERTSRRREVSK